MRVPWILWPCGFVMWNSGKWRDHDLITDLKGNGIRNLSLPWMKFSTGMFDVLLNIFLTCCLINFKGWHLFISPFWVCFDFFIQKMMFDGLFTDGEFMTLFRAFLGEVVGIVFLSVQYPSIQISRLSDHQHLKSTDNIKQYIHNIWYIGVFFGDFTLPSWIMGVDMILNDVQT